MNSELSASALRTEKVPKPTRCYVMLSELWGRRRAKQISWNRFFVQEEWCGVVWLSEGLRKTTELWKNWYPSHRIGNLTAYIRGAQTFPIYRRSLKILGASYLILSKPHSWGPTDIRAHRPEFVHLCSRAMFLNRRAAARYRALALIIPGRERFSWNW